MIFSRLIWKLARKTAQYREFEKPWIKHYDEIHDRWAKMHGQLMREVTAQQNANRIKKRKLRGLRAGLRLYR